MKGSDDEFRENELEGSLLPVAPPTGPAIPTPAADNPGLTSFLVTPTPYLTSLLSSTSFLTSSTQVTVNNQRKPRYSILKYAWLTVVAVPDEPVGAVVPRPADHHRGGERQGFGRGGDKCGDSPLPGYPHTHLHNDRH